MPTVPPIGPAPGAPAPMPEVPLRDKIARAKTLVRRGFKYWKLASVLFVIGVGIALYITLPWSGLWVLGTLIAIELIMHGAAWLEFGLGLRRFR